MKQFIERQIITGLIVSTDYVHQILPIWNNLYIKSAAARKIAVWCLDYFQKYEKTPGPDIENIFLEKLNTELSKTKDLADDIQDILEDLSDEYEKERQFNVKYLVDSTTEYFDKVHLEQHITGIQNSLNKNDLTEAQKQAFDFKPLLKNVTPALDFADKDTLKVVERAFKEAAEPLIKYPKQLGAFWNSEFVRGGFVALMAPEKRGKTFFMMDFVRRAARQGLSVAFFQAGDMTESQQIRRFGINLSGVSDKKKFCGEQYEVVRDCVHNQRDTCDKKIRESGFGVFEHLEEDYLRNEITFDELKEAYEDFPDYKPCHNCSAYNTEKIGAPFLKKINVEEPLTGKKAVEFWKKFYTNRKQRIMMSTHANKTLTVKEIESILSLWEKERGFVPDVIVIDYADILVSENREFRHGQNEIWMSLRGLAQKKNCLILTATQADAKGHESDLLKPSNFSEDKRKYAHVTAMYGLNSDPKGREKKIGLLRINKIVIREDEFHYTDTVTVLQNLKRGQPILGSYF